MDYQAETIRHVLDELAYWGRALRRRGPDDWWAKVRPFSRDNTEAWELAHNGVAYRPADWLDRPLTEAERQAFSRGVKELERVGVIVAVASPSGRVSHLRPTARGLAVGLRLCPEADRAAIRKALTTTKWATKEHLRAIDATEEAGADE